MLRAVLTVCESCSVFSLNVEDASVLKLLDFFDTLQKNRKGLGVWVLSQSRVHRPAAPQGRARPV